MSDTLQDILNIDEMTKGTPSLSTSTGTTELTRVAAAFAHTRAAEQRFHILADNVPQLVWMADGSGSIFWYNQRWYDYTGTTPDEMMGWGWQKVHHPEYVEAVTEKFQAHVLTGEPWEDTFPLRGADGRYRWFLSRAFSIRDAAGDIALWCGTNTDITDQRETEAALSRAEERVKELYALISRSDLSFSEKAQKLLQTGRKWLGLDVGVLSRTDCDADLYTVAQIDADIVTPPVGFTVPLGLTFCSETIKRSPESPPLAVEYAGLTLEWQNHPAYLKFRTEAYLGAAIWVNGKVWGSLSFWSPAPRSVPFTSFDFDIIRLTAQWFAGQVAQQEAEDTLRITSAQQRRFIREILSSVTEGKLRLCDVAQDLPVPLPPASDVVELTSATLRVLRRRVEAGTQALSMPAERSHDLLTAVGEAAMNAVRHGGGGMAQVHIDPDRGIVQVWVRDSGAGIRDEDLHRATLEKGWSGAGSLGHGFFLMLRTADRTYLLTGSQGTTVVLEQEMEAPQPAWLAPAPFASQAAPS